MDGQSRFGFVEIDGTTHHVEIVDYREQSYGLNLPMYRVATVDGREVFPRYTSGGWAYYSEEWVPLRRVHDVHPPVLIWNIPQSAEVSS